MKKPVEQMLLETVVQATPRLVVRPSVRQGVPPLRLEPRAQSWLGEVGSQALVTSPEPEGHTGPTRSASTAKR